MRGCIARIGLRLTTLSILLPVLLAPLVVQAERRPVDVVELFTSQGCSSCPPADAVLAELAQKDGVVALAYHVDYWDYLGWKDEMATPQNTARQRAYGEAFDSSVYTPQAVINGRRHMVGSQRSEIIRALESSESEEMPRVDVHLSSSNGSVFVDIGKAGPAPKDVRVLMVYYEPRQVVEIRGGENKGRSIDYRNIVTSYQVIGMWHGEAIRLELPRSEMMRWGGQCAVLVQAFDGQGRPGPILGAASTSGEGW